MRLAELLGLSALAAYVKRRRLEQLSETEEQFIIRRRNLIKRRLAAHRRKDVAPSALIDGYLRSGCGLEQIIKAPDGG
jgi:hypothetical protein